MARINILAQSKKADWGKISSDFTDMHLTVVEIFPIPNELGFDDDALAINVHKGFGDKKKAVSELTVLIQYLFKNNFTVTELYDGIEINSSNIQATVEPLLA
jgi:hypothetical protein